MYRTRIPMLVALAAACAISPLSVTAKPRAAHKPRISVESAKAATVPAGLLIVPGRSIGQTALGPHGAAILAKLPKADASDVGMNQRRLVWISKSGPRETLYLHTVNNGVIDAKPISGLTIDEIRVTSPDFRLASGLHTGSSLAEIRRQFPHIQRVSHDPKIYDDLRAGIAFEFATQPTESSRCTAIIIHPKGSRRVEGADVVRNIIKGGRG